MKSLKTKRLALLAILTALSLVFGKVLSIPTPTGMLTLLDVGIYFTAFYLGSREGFVVGGFSGFLIDLISGYPQWMFISLFAHGMQGYFAGLTGSYRIVGQILATVVMVGTYFTASSIMYGVGAASAEVLGNFSQNLLGLIGGFVLCQAVKRLER